MGRVEAVLPLTSPVFFRERARLLALLGTHRLPAIFSHREFVDAGGLMAYGPSFAEMWRRAADYVDRLWQGAKPADLPSSRGAAQAVSSLSSTARPLRHFAATLPPMLLFQADEVIR